MSFSMAPMSGTPSGPAGYSSGMGSAGMGNKIPKGHELARVQNFTPEQMQLFQSMFGHLGPDSFLGKLASGSQEGFDQLEAPALRQFQELSGQLASRFSGGGSRSGVGGSRGMSARSGSGFQNASQSYASQFAQDLQAQRMGIQRQSLQDLMGMSNSLLNQRAYDQSVVKKPDSMLQQLLPGLFGGITKMGTDIGTGYFSKLLGI